MTNYSHSRSLTKREVEIIRLLAQEYSTKEIAAQLFLSSETIKSHRRNIQAKLRVRNVAGTVRAAFEYGILKVA